MLLSAAFVNEALIRYPHWGSTGYSPAAIIGGMDTVTAIVLSAQPDALEIPGVSVLRSVGARSTAAQLHAARLDALEEVSTKWCFFLDDDDALPGDYLQVLAQCMAQAGARGVPMAYTDELVFEQGREPYRRCWYDYDRDRHRTSPMGLHHLVLMDTHRAREVARSLPRGNYWTEHMLYWALGAEGAVYVPRVGYHWVRSSGGFSRDPRMVTAQIMTRRWIETQQSAEVPA